MPLQSHLLLVSSVEKKKVSPDTGQVYDQLHCRKQPSRLGERIISFEFMWFATIGARMRYYSPLTALIVGVTCILEVSSKSGLRDIVVAEI